VLHDQKQDNIINYFKSADRERQRDNGVLTLNEESIIVIVDKLNVLSCSG